ncbi:MAG: GTP-binding protein [Promethearchaeota archaeon]
MDENCRVLNVLIAGHAQHGKSSLIQAICGVFPDNLDFELIRGTTVTLKVIEFALEKKNLLINFLDSPGHADFKGAIALGLSFADLIILVIAGNEGFQARTYWLYQKANEMNVPIIVAATKMDLRNANIDIIKVELNKLNTKKIFPIIKTSAKKIFGIDELINKISLYTKDRIEINDNLSFIILGYDNKKGFGELLNIGLLSGTIENIWITDKIKIRHLLSLDDKPLKKAVEGQIVKASLNIDADFALGTIYREGKFLPANYSGNLSEIKPRKEYFITIDDPIRFKIGVNTLAKLKKVIPSFDFYIDNGTISILVLGDLQFEFIKKNLEELIEFQTVGSKTKGIITINSISEAKFGTAHIRIVPRCANALTISRGIYELSEPKLIDILGVSVARQAFHIDGLHATIYSGKNEDDIAQAIALAIEKTKLIKIIPFQDVIVKVENQHDLFPIIEKYNIEVLHQDINQNFFLQIKIDDFEPFFNSLMKISKGTAEISLFRFEKEDLVLAVDPGTRHFGFCLMERGKLPSLWYVNLKSNIENLKSRNRSQKSLRRELDTFLQYKKDLIKKIFIGNGPGSKFVAEFLKVFFNMQEDTDNDEYHKHRFSSPEIYVVDEYKTTKEALFHLQKGKLVNEVQSKGFVDHAIAALLIARRGIKGEIIKIHKAPIKKLHDYIIENYSGSYSFSSIHNIDSLDDLKRGMYLRIKNSSKLDSRLTNGEIIAFNGFGQGYGELHATTISGNKIIVKFQGNVKIKRDFFKIFTPMKERSST